MYMLEGLIVGRGGPGRQCVSITAFDVRFCPVSATLEADVRPEAWGGGRKLAEAGTDEHASRPRGIGPEPRAAATRHGLECAKRITPDD
jgi:hypothetical protein